MKNQLEEFLPFLENNSRIELKSVALSHIVSKSKTIIIKKFLQKLMKYLFAGLTGTNEGVEIIIANHQLLKTLVELTTDPSYVIAKDACFGKNIHIKQESEINYFNFSSHQHIRQQRTNK